jgi:hypothetical protein
MTVPTIDRVTRALHRTGWSLGEFSTAGGFAVTLTRDERTILATAPTQTDAWVLAERAAVWIDGAAYEE